MQNKSKKYPYFIAKKDGNLREVSDAEDQLISWFWWKFLYARKNSFFAHIPDMTDTDDPYRPAYSEEWLESAKNEFINFYRKTHHRHTDQEKQIAEAFRANTRRQGHGQKPVRNTDTGEVFPSMSAACLAYRIDKRGFSKAIRNHWRIGGCYWEYIGNGENATDETDR